MSVMIGRPGRKTENAREYGSRYVMTRRQLRHAAAAREAHGASWWMRLGMKALGLPLCVVCCYGLLILWRGPEHEFRGMFMAMYGLFLLVGLGLLGHGTLFVWLNCLDRSLSGILGREVVSRVTQEGVSSGFLGTEQLIPWRGFRGGGASRKGLILLLEGGGFLWLPADSFGDEEAWQAVRRLAGERLRGR